MPVRFFIRSVICSLAVGIFGGAALLHAEESVHETLLNPPEKQDMNLQKTTVPSDSGNWRRDPFLLQKEKRPVQYIPGFSSGKNPGSSIMKDVAPDPIRLQGIMQVGSRSYALINGRFFRVGDSVNEGIVVKEIGKYQIVVHMYGDLHTYNIFQGKLK
jgi:hypothetical protein